MTCSREEVPDELWLSIFHGLLPDTLKAISLSSQKFKALSRPLLFNHVTFHFGLRPFPLSLQCMDFWCSDEIAPHVRSCKLSVWGKLGVSASKMDSPSILLASFFERLGRFTRLTKFHIYYAQFTQWEVITLCRAAALTDVKLVGCGIATGEHVDPSPLQLNVDRFSLGKARGEADLWISLLRPEYLRELDLNLAHNHPFDTTAIPVFPRVHKLTTTMKYSDMSYNLAILSKFPAVEIFAVHGWGDVEAGPGIHVEASLVLPVIRQYTSDCDRAMTVLLPRTTLTHLAVRHCNPHSFTTR
ncbi:hypothetical protein K438DRAFT_1847144 [Mycena galopus ATCC 62051]|nr:hypothetical protein K438DRAFT_1847144 [Mycena galopus ATCC 62051]